LFSMMIFMVKIKRLEKNILPANKSILINILYFEHDKRAVTDWCFENNDNIADA